MARIHGLGIQDMGLDAEDTRVLLGPMDGVMTRTQRPEGVSGLTLGG